MVHENPLEAAKRSHDDVALVLSIYDANNDGELSDDEVVRIKEDFKNRSGAGYEVVQRRYAAARGGEPHGDADDLSEEIVRRIRDDVNTTGIAMRYLALAGACARAVKYLRVFFRPLANPYVVRASFMVTWSFILGDVGYQAHHMHEHCGISGTPLYLAALKRFTFHSIASVALPAYTIPAIVGTARKILSANKSFASRHPLVQKLAPPLFGVCSLPLIPLFYDRPVGYLCDCVFDDVIVRSARQQ